MPFTKQEKAKLVSLAEKIATLERRSCEHWSEIRKIIGYEYPDYVDSLFVNGDIRKAMEEDEGLDWDGMESLPKTIVAFAESVEQRWIQEAELEELKASVEKANGRIAELEKAGVNGKASSLVRP